VSYLERISEGRPELWEEIDKLRAALNIAKKALLAIALDENESINTTEVERLQTEVAKRTLGKIKEMVK
jgi:hypothetical protein